MTVCFKRRHLRHTGRGLDISTPTITQVRQHILVKRSSSLTDDELLPPEEPCQDPCQRPDRFTPITHRKTSSFHFLFHGLKRKSVFSRPHRDDQLRNHEARSLQFIRTVRRKNSTLLNTSGNVAQPQ